MMMMMIIIIIIIKQPPNGIVGCLNAIFLIKNRTFISILKFVQLGKNSIPKFNQDLASLNFGAHLDIFRLFFS